MNREFQAVYRHTDPLFAGKPVGDALSVNVVAEDADHARGLLATAGFAVISVSEVRVLVDWSKPLLTRDELAAFLNMKPGTLSGLTQDGKRKNGKKRTSKIPWSKFGNGGCPTILALAHIKKHLNECGRQLLAEQNLAA